MRIRNYTMEDFEKQFEIAKEQLKIFSALEDELETKEITINFTEKEIHTLGYCERLYNGTYEIVLNKIYADSEPIENINNTIMHELLHTFNGCMQHTGRWKQLAEKVNCMFNYNISRTSTTTNNYKEEVEDKKRVRKPKYIVTCPNCGQEYTYYRNCKIIDYIKQGTSKCHCGHCDNVVMLELTTC